MKKKYFSLTLFIFFVSFSFFAEDSNKLQKEMKKEKDELLKYIISSMESQKSDITLFELENKKTSINLKIIYDNVLSTEGLYLQHQKLTSDNYNKFINKNSFTDRNGTLYSLDSTIVLKVKPFILNNKYSLESVLNYYRGIASYLRGEEDLIFKDYFKRAIELNEGFYQAKLFLILFTNSQTLTNLVEISELHNNYYNFNLGYYYAHKGRYNYNIEYAKALYNEFINLNLLLARCAKNEKNITEMDFYYNNAVQKTSKKSDLEKLIYHEWKEASDSIKLEIANNKGFKSIQEYENYIKRTMPENLTKFLQVGDCIPFVLGDVIKLDDVSSYKIRIAQVNNINGLYEFLVGYYRPESFSKYCYILSKDDLSGNLTLKYIGNKDYIIFDVFGNKNTINTYVF